MYSTELMEQILTSEIGQQIIQRVTNKYGNSYVGLWLFQIIGMSNDEVKAMVEDFKNQTLPQTATWSLSLWEQSMGLPVNESESVEQRRQNIIEKRRRRNAMNPARIEEIISAMTGTDVRIDEYYGKNRFAIYLSSIPSLVDELSVRKKLKVIKQSHKVFDIFYEQAIKGSRTSHYIFGRAEGGNQMIALGCDHGGYELKQEIIKYLEDKKIPYKDFGCDSTEAVDYPIYARKVGNAILQGECEKGILICGTGIGISIAANKMKGIRAALCTDCFCAEATREHNDANVLALGGRVVGPGLAVKIVDTFLNTEFSHAPRHQHRIDLIEE